MLKKIVKKSFLGIFLLSYCSMAMPMEPQEDKDTILSYSIIGPIMLSTSYLCSLSHEYGHKLVGKALLNLPSTIHFGLAGAVTRFYANSEADFQQDSFRYIAMVAAGPACGFLSAFGIWKLSQMMKQPSSHNQYLRFVNDGLKTGAVLAGMQNTFNLLPLPANPPTDGSAIINSLRLIWNKK